MARATAPTLTPEHRDVLLPAGRPATIVMVSDTHSRPDPRALAQIEARAPDLILHGGDVGDLEVLERLAQIAPLHAVRGNIDDSSTVPGVPPDALSLSFIRDASEVLRVLLTHIAVYGPKLHANVRKVAAAERVDVVACGHSHVPLLVKDGAFVLFNPGSIGPRRFGLPIAFGVLSLADRLTFQHIDVDTGEVWHPTPRA